MASRLTAASAAVARLPSVSSESSEEFFDACETTPRSRSVALLYVAKREIKPSFITHTVMILGIFVG